MSKYKITPGFWYASGDEVLIDMGDKTHLVATVEDWAEDTVPYTSLIAAAPAMLEALESIFYCCDEDHAARDYASRQAEIRGIAIAALRAAKGEA